MTICSGRQQTPPKQLPELDRNSEEGTHKGAVEEAGTSKGVDHRPPEEEDWWHVDHGATFATLEALGATQDATELRGYVPHSREEAKPLAGPAQRERWTRAAQKFMADRAHRHWVDNLAAPAHPFDHTIDMYERPALHTHMGWEYSTDMVSQPTLGNEIRRGSTILPQRRCSA